MVASLELLLRLLDSLLVLLGGTLLQLLYRQVLREKTPINPTESFSSEKSESKVENWF